MKVKFLKMGMRRIVLAAVIILIDGTAHGVLTTNNWKVGDGKWELGANWSLNTPPAVGQDQLFIANNTPTGGGVTTIDVTTVQSNVINGCMTVTNLQVGGTFLSPHTLFLNNANNTPGNIGLTVVGSFILTTHGSLVITNSRFRVDSNHETSEFTIDGNAVLLSGSMVATNPGNFATIGSLANGSLSVSNGTVQLLSLTVGSSAAGTLTIAGGTNQIFDTFNIAIGPVTGTVWLTGGQLVVTNNDVFLGAQGSGQMTVSNGTALFGEMRVGYFHGLGMLSQAGGTNTITEGLSIGDSSLTTGSVWLSGGQLVVPNGATEIGNAGTGQMTVSNGTWLTQAVSIGVSASSCGTLTFAGGTTLLTNPAAGLPNFLTIAEKANSTGAVWMTGGQLITTNCTTLVSSNGVGQMTISNGTWNALATIVGESTGSRGSLTIAGGTNTYLGLLTGLVIGDSPGATGGVWVTGGQLLLTNIFGDAEIGNSGSGFLTQSNGTVHIYNDDVGENPGSQGTLTVAGGDHIIDSGLYIGNLNDATGAVWITGGQLVVTNSNTSLGNEGIGHLTMSNGTWLAQSVLVGRFDGSEGTITSAGGSATISSNLVLGDCQVDAEGFVIVKGGEVFVTNATHTAVLDIRNGFVTLTAGLLMVDKLVMTNECGLIFHEGGSLIVRSLVLDPDLDADADGLPNGWEQQHGLDPLTATGSDGADGDPDHDGFTNLEEYEAGTDPRDPNSTPLRITSILQEGNDVLLTWTTAGGKTNVVQATAGTSGNYSNNFTDLSPVMVPAAIGLTSVNYLDVGGATNKPARYYRVRLVP